MAEDEQVAEASGGAVAAKPAKSMGTLVLVLVGVLLTVGGNAAVILFLRPKTAPTEPAKPAVVETKVKSTLHLETFVVNLPDPEHHAYLRVGIELGLSKVDEKKSEKKEGTDAAAPGPVPQVRDTIIAVLSQSKPDDLLTSEGKMHLKEDLVKQLQDKMPELGVREVYFTEFLMQH